MVVNEKTYPSHNSSNEIEKNLESKKTRYGKGEIQKEDNKNDDNNSNNSNNSNINDTNEYDDSEIIHDNNNNGTLLQHTSLMHQQQQFPLPPVIMTSYDNSFLPQDVFVDGNKLEHNGIDGKLIHTAATTIGGNAPVEANMQLFNFGMHPHPHHNLHPNTWGNTSNPTIYSNQTTVIAPNCNDLLEVVLGVFPCAHLRGLPYEATVEDVLIFFHGLVILDVIVCGMVGNKRNKYNGEAFVIFANPMDFQLALQRNRQRIGRRYVEVYQGERSDYHEAIAVQYNLYKNKSSLDSSKSTIELNKSSDTSNSSKTTDLVEKTQDQKCISLNSDPDTTNSTVPANIKNMAKKGISYNQYNRQNQHIYYPHHQNYYSNNYQHNEHRGKNFNRNNNNKNTNTNENTNHNLGGGAQVGEHTGYLRLRGLPYTATIEDITFFFSPKCSIVEKESIALTYKNDGRATGEAYVKLTCDAKKAMALHKKMIGSRYIELFISHKEEFNRAFSKFQKNIS